MKITVIIRDPAPFILLQEPMTYRHVTFDLTEEQLAMLRLRSSGVSGGKPITEQISHCFFEGGK